MKKHTKFLFFLLLSMHFSLAKAQFVTIPDTNFANWLQVVYPSCMNGNLMDTTCNAIVTATSAYCQSLNIFDLDGIQYFDNLQALFCFENNLTYLPSLPINLAFLECSNNQLTSLPSLPNGLIALYCTVNQISTFPPLPTSLKFLYCEYNQLTVLPNLPDSLETLYANNNQITVIGSFPNALTDIHINYNQLIDLPELPDSIHWLYAYSNPNLQCLPLLKKISYFAFYGTSVQCLPNYGNVASSNPILSSLPLCDIFNTNGCPSYWNISGKVYADTNNNCLPEVNENGLPNLKLLLDSAGTLIQQIYTGGQGFYSFNTDTGNYTYSVDTTDIPIYVSCPVSGFQTSVLTILDSMDYNMDFGMKCKPGFDLGVKSISAHSWNFKPGHLANVYFILGDLSNFYGLHCASGVGGSVQIIFSGNVSYVSPLTGALIPIVSGDTLIYSISDFGNVNVNTAFGINVQIDSLAQAGNQICFSATVTPTMGDIYVDNNSLSHCFTVFNSLDPNFKEVSPLGIIDTSQQWLTYTVNFQNIGTTTAEHIYILDTLDNDLEAASFELLSYSHQPITQIAGNVARFNFPNINLPDSTNDEPNSHGYVQYRVKITGGITPGTIISNAAYIIFDFNPPVATNTVTNQIQNTSGLISYNLSPDIIFQIYPNPTDGNFNISYLLPQNQEGKLEIFDVTGKCIYKTNVPMGSTLQQVKLPSISEGLYNCVITSGNVRSSNKVGILK